MTTDHDSDGDAAAADAEIETVSIIVPVYNDPDGIAATLESIGPQLGPKTELLVVDNGSTDRTPSVVAEYERKFDHVELVVEDEIQSSYAARNTGARQSTGSVCAFVDADMTVPPDWLEQVRRTMATRDEHYVGCNVELTLPDEPTLPARYDHHTGFPVKQYISRQDFTPTCCLLVRREVFEDVGLFDHRLISGGDKEFGNRVVDAGYSIHFAENVTLYHPVRESLRALITKDHRVGRGLCQLQQYHPDRYGDPGIPPRPSGIKSPDRELERRDRIGFSLLSTVLTGVRGIGYYHEFLVSRRENTDGPGSLSNPRELTPDDDR
ncbi:glycosyltransferase [Natronolimnobius baerhuensis]|uniref:Glycosyltransferase n=1 Tax=Natronolimnobius baerhuensis TaxID=253108 RepID=A0A202EDU2_9EURY|nr:glycosyltransferase [Natronolimnobius baerhuensis]OVE86422.1 glycosyltransferase [Natronolimnobius baerhuensis]